MEKSLRMELEEFKNIYSIELKKIVDGYINDIQSSVDLPYNELLHKKIDIDATIPSEHSRLIERLFGNFFHEKSNINIESRENFFSFIDMTTISIFNKELKRFDEITIPILKKIRKEQFPHQPEDPLLQ